MEKRVSDCLNLLRGLQFEDFNSEDQHSMLDVMEDFFTANESDSDDTYSDCEDTICNHTLNPGR